jgi:MoxR-like ATPase
MPRLTISTETIVEALIAFNDGETNMTTADVRAFCASRGYNLATINNRLNDYKTGRGKFNLKAAEVVEELESAIAAPSAQPVGEVTTIIKEYQSLVPVVDELFVPFGNFVDVKSVLKSRIFYPVFITGLSGNGKTHSVEQACAQLKRDLVRVNVTIETDEDDLIGGFRLVNGETVWHDGPVVESLKRGAVLLLDEIDLASNKIMCLQSLLEGKGVYLKKTNTYVKPAPGFNVIATANTKGRGCDDGKFIGTNVLNEAFLERFAVTFEQEYPSPSIERKILTRNFVALGCNECLSMVENLVTWADIIRKTYQDGGVEDVISTRRLINIARAYIIWGKIEKALELCTNRFDSDTKSVFVELYQKVSGGDFTTESETPPESPVTNETPNF